MNDNEENNLNNEQQDINAENNQQDLNNNNTIDVKGEKPKRKNLSIKYIIITLAILLLVGGVAAVGYKLSSTDNNKSKKNNTDKKVMKSEFAIKGNGLDNFDLYHLKNNNDNKNKVYSPISIKTSLAMLSDAANGDTKNQIDAVIGNYKPKKYVNSKNMSFANSMFIRSDSKESIKDEYIKHLKNKYDADVQYDSFATPDIVNKWTEDKTFGQIKNLVDDISTFNFVQVNALGIDMEWVKVFQPKSIYDAYSVTSPHTKFGTHVSSLDTDFDGLQFNNQYEAQSGEFAAVINRYDIVNELGEENIRKTVGDAYKEWLIEDPCGTGNANDDVDTYLDKYIKEIGEGYNHVSSSTDFKIYSDDNLKAFSKDLKTYDGLTLQYVAVMPKNDTLDTFINNTDADSLNTIIKNLKEIKLKNFNDKVVTKIVGNMPFFDFQYEINLIEELKKVGVTDIFDVETADLTNMIKTKGVYIDKLIHKANIQVSNEGIKAAAATMAGGLGAAHCGFDYFYDLPVEEINMDFDKPFLYLVRNKDTGEVWFTGTVYQPTEFVRRSY